jgi:hypothetical protein
MNLVDIWTKMHWTNQNDYSNKLDIFNYCMIILSKILIKLHS